MLGQPCQITPFLKAPYPMTTCALCTTPGASPVDLPVDETVTACPACAKALTGEIDPARDWSFLTDAMWSEDEGTKIAAYRLLRALSAQAWAAEALDTLWMEDDLQARADAAQVETSAGVIHRDSNGAVLAQGDTIVLIKDLPVKGSSMVAKRGTAVRNIRLVRDNPDQVEGRVNDQQIVILCQYTRKSG